MLGARDTTPGPRFYTVPALSPHYTVPRSSPSRTPWNPVTGTPCGNPVIELRELREGNPVLEPRDGTL
jgi:hypothetical protein